MKKIIILSLLFSSFFANADYVMVLDKETNDYQTAATEKGDWSNWQNSSGYYDCGEWLPKREYVYYGNTFMQTSHCKQNQTRTRTIFEVYDDGRKLEKSQESENQTVTRTKFQGAVGMKESCFTDSGSYIRKNSDSSYYYFYYQGTRKAQSTSVPYQINNLLYSRGTLRNVTQIRVGTTSSGHPIYRYDYKYNVCIKGLY